MDIQAYNSEPAYGRTWWNRQNRPFDRSEVIADTAIHLVGLALALIAGTILLVFAATRTAPEELPALIIYVGSLLTVLGASLAYNLWPVSPIKRHLARLDQGSIFLFIAGTYTPFLALLNGSPLANPMMVGVWGLALVGIALKVFVPDRFGRVAILLYLAIGWSGLLVFQSLAERIPTTALWLLLAGGIVYSLGIIFHLWEKLRFQNALWHVAVVTGASLHLLAIIDCMVLSRL